MLYIYTPDTVGGKIIFKGSYSSVNAKDYYFNDYSISIKYKSEDKLLFIFVFKDTEIIELTSSIELKIENHPENDDYRILKYNKL